MSDLIDRQDVLRKMENVMDMQELYLPIHFKEGVIDECPTIDAVPRQKYEEDMESVFAHGYTDAESNFRKMIADGELVEVVRCKDCKRHNGAFGDFLINEQRYLREDEVCPLVYWRGKAKGNEFDYQYCIYGERRTNETD